MTLQEAITARHSVRKYIDKDIMRVLVLIVLFMPPLFLSAQMLNGKVVKIADGDTFTLLVNGKEQVKIRIDGIDAPEKGQAYGNRAKEYLSGMIWGEVITVQVKKKDRYGRSIGRVSTSTIKDVGIEMIKAGYAWQYRDYNNDLSYTTAENRARKNMKGLWQDKNPIRPQVFRKIRRNNVR
jgi:endonuclease YncB( thermonuclease family)